MTDGAARGTRFAPYVLGALVISVIGIFLLSWTDNSTELSPNRDENTVTIGLWVAVVAAAITLAIILGLKIPQRGPRFIMTPLLAFPIGLLAGILAFSLADRIWQTIDFAGANTYGEQRFHISRAYVSHGKGVRYHIQLSEYFADLNLDQDDYTQTFGASEEVRPVGFCLYAPVERNSRALRIMYSSSRPIPPGRVRRCT